VENCGQNVTRLKCGESRGGNCGQNVTRLKCGESRGGNCEQNVTSDRTVDTSYKFRMSRVWVSNFIYFEMHNI
jgi:hypothetical protein